jgi:hypothetical protein
MSYNAFRTWRKSNGIAGTAKELSDARRVYSGSKQQRSSEETSTGSTMRASPKTSPKHVSKTSPKSSPVRYGGLARPALTGLPPDVSRLILETTGNAEVRPMLLASTGTGRMVQEKLRRVCDEPLTQLEILASLETLPLPIGIAIAREQVPAWQLLHQGELYVVSRSGKSAYFSPIGRGPVTDKVEKVYSRRKEPIRGFVEYVTRADDGLAFAAHLSPLSLLHAYERRLSCRRVDAGYAPRIRKLASDYLMQLAMLVLVGTLRNEGAIRRVEAMIGGTLSTVSLSSADLFVIDRFRRGVGLDELVRQVAWTCTDASLIMASVPLVARYKDEGDEEAYTSLMRMMVEALRDTYKAISSSVSAVV